MVILSIDEFIKTILLFSGLINSFQGDHGEIEYKLIARINIPNWPDKKFKKVIYIDTNGIIKNIPSNVNVTLVNIAD